MRLSVPGGAVLAAGPATRAGQALGVAGFGGAAGKLGFASPGEFGVGVAATGRQVQHVLGRFDRRGRGRSLSLRMSAP